MKRGCYSGGGMFLAQCGCILLILGGLADQLVRELLPVHAEIMGMASEPVAPRVAALVLALLHALGYALVATGFGAFLLLRQANASGQRHLALCACSMTTLAEGTNALHMYMLQQPFFVVALAIAALIAIGTALFTATPLRQP